MRYFILILCLCKVQVKASDWMNRTIRVDLNTDGRTIARQEKFFVRSERILNSINASNGQYPWSVVTLAWAREGPTSWVGIPGSSSIISKNFALTDFRCTGQELEPNPATVIEAHVGEVRWHMLDTPTSFMRHIWYIEPSVENRPYIALLQFHVPLTYNPNIHPIRLPATGNFSYEGWASVSLGFDWLGASFIQQLQFVNINILSNSECSLIGNLADHEMCAVDASGVIRLYFAFVGGAWVTFQYDNFEYYATLAGIDQYQYVNETSSFVVATKVSHFVEWIEELTAEVEA